MLYSFLIVDGLGDSSFLQKILSVMESFPDYWYLGTCDPSCALAEIISKKPQVVFMIAVTEAKDTNFSYPVIASMHQYVENMPYLISVAKDASLALMAIQSGVSDYIVNSFEIHIIGPSLKRFEKRSKENIPFSVCIKSHSDYQFVELKDIVYLKADNNTTDIFLSNGRIVNAYKTLKHFEATFPFYFLRIHKSYIVNINFVSRIHVSKSKCYLNYSEIIPFSQSYRNNVDEILARMKKLGQHT